MLPQKTYVLFFNSQPWFDAVVSVHLAVMKHLDRDKYDVFLATHAPIQGDRFEEANPITRRDLAFPKLDRHRPLQAIRDTALSVFSFLSLARYIRKNHIAILHTSDKPRDSVYGLLLTKLTGCKFVLHAHIRYDYMNRALPIRWALSSCDRLVTISDDCSKSFIAGGYARDHITVVHNAVDLERFTPNVEPVDLRSLAELPSDAKIIGIAGRIFDGKGHGDLVEALPLIVRQVPNAFLVAIGPEVVPGYIQELRAAAERLGVLDHLHILPPVQNVERVFRSFDISVTPSRGEPFGLVVVEAMASGTPVVATDAGGIPEIVTNGVDGLLVPPRDPEALAGAIIQLLTNQELAERLKNTALETARTRFPEPLMAQQFDRIYTSLLGV